MKKIILGIVIGVIVSLPINAVVARRQKVYDPTRDTHKRYDDPDFQVKCWSISIESLSCLPWSEVKER